MSPTSPQRVDIGHPSLLIRINKLYNRGMSPQALYEATRGVWVLGERRELAEYALSIYKGVVQEVYQIDSWQPAGTSSYTTRTRRDVEAPGRWEFSGSLAPTEIRARYVGRSVAHLFRRGAANPVTYAGIDD